MAKHNGVQFSFVSTYDEIEVALIAPSSSQLRRNLGNLDELVESIRSSGLFEPIVVRPKGNHFEIIAGNRRYQACKKLNYRRVPAVVLELNDREAYEAALIENIQRKTLDPIEEAQNFLRYCKEYGWGSESDLASRIGKSQEYVSHRLKLLSLPEEIMRAVQSSSLSVSVAEELVWLKDPQKQKQLLDLLLDQKLTKEQVREAVKAVKADFPISPPEAPWPNYSSGNRRKKNPDEIIVDKAILSLRICMVRLDSLLEKARDPNLRKVLLNKRVSLHELLSELVSYKRSRES